MKKLEYCVCVCVCACVRASVRACVHALCCVCCVVLCFIILSSTSVKLKYLILLYVCDYVEYDYIETDRVLCVRPVDMFD